MKKILFLIYNLDGGGAEKVLLKILEKIDKNKFKIDLFLIKKEGVYLKEFETKFKDITIRTPYDNLSKNKLLNRIQYKLKHKKVRKSLKNPEIFKEFIKEKYDTQIAFLEGMSSIYLSKTECRNKIAWVHVDLEKHRTMTIDKEREIYKNYNKIICVSNQAKNSFDKIYPEYSNKSTIIYNPIDKEEIINKSSEEVEKFRDKNIVTFIAIGRLNEQKGFDILLKAHKLLKDENLENNIVILGEGTERKNLEKYILENDLEKSVKLLGFKKNPYPYLKQSDIYILSSRYEGYSLTVAEALVLNKAIISTRCIGPMELLENGKYGLMCNSEDIYQLKECMKKFILNKKLREEYEEKTKIKSKEMQMKSIIEKIENMI
ncbi:glycosyltransferase [Fusobacterium sp. SB021]|uniref:glycosyltransferase n=1 Tax=Fusobacterium sp. SB021 TaxID=2744227 RepID=UPI003CF7DD0F